MTAAAPSLPQLGPPPRDVPRGLELRMLGRTVDPSLVFSIPAAVVLCATAIVRPPMAGRIVLLIVGLVLLYPAWRLAIPPLRRAMRTVRRMRLGSATLGRMVTARFEWDSRGAAKPYGEFIGNYVVMLARSQVNKVTGCVIGCFGFALLIPFTLVIVAVGIALVLNKLGVGHVTVEGDASFAYFAKFVGGSVLFFLTSGIYIWWWRRDIANQAEAMVEEARAESAGGRDFPDAHTRQLMAMARDPGVEIPLKEPLPAASASNAWLICGVEYSAGGAKQLAETRVPLTSELNLHAIEPLLFEQARPGEVDLFLMLSREAAIEVGQWKSRNGARGLASLVSASIFMGGAIGALLIEVVSIAMGVK
jgi:hypothetical protein